MGLSKKGGDDREKDRETEKPDHVGLSGASRMFPVKVIVGTQWRAFHQNPSATGTRTTTL